MIFRQVIQEDLSCASYLIGDTSTGVAAVVDPQWDPSPYLQLARLHGLRIEHVLETQVHADHVSGHGQLARATGATIHIHAAALAEHPHEAFEDGWRLELGDVTVVALHTPGHTAFIVDDRALLTGDASLDHFLALPDAVEVWPGHIGDGKPSSTIGFERRAARPRAGAGRRPPNVELIEALNRGPLVEELGAPAPLSPRAVEVAIAEGAILVDARTNDQFDEAHIPCALSVSAYDTGFATKVAHVVPENVEVIVVAASDGPELQAAQLLASVGIRVRGYLSGGMTAWRSEGRPVERVPTLAPADVGDDVLVLDVREPGEDHHPGATVIPYPELLDRLAELPRDRPIATVCSAGRRSGLAASILQREGFQQVLHVTPSAAPARAPAGR